MRSGALRFRVSLATTAAVVVGGWWPSRRRYALAAAPSPLNKRDEDEVLGVYLTKESRSHLQKYLEEQCDLKGYEGKVVVVRKGMDASDTYLYQPLYGERNAFRIKGLVKASCKGDDKNASAECVVAVGRVSNVLGELIDDDCVASLVLEPTAAPFSNATRAWAIDLPTRLSKMSPLSITAADTSKPWTGEVPAGHVLGRFFTNENLVSYVPVEQLKQLVIDGYLCSSKHVDEEGNCTFDRSSITEEPPPTSSSTLAGEEASKAKRMMEVKREEAAQQAEAEEGECPVCQYMKAGPCKNEFLQWDVCVNGMQEGDDLAACFSSTLKMMECMKIHEYYDVMTAGTDAKMAAARTEHEAKANS